MVFAQGIELDLIPILLFSGALAFTILKSLLLCLRRENRVGTVAIFISYAIESLLGIGISVFVAIKAWRTSFFLDYAQRAGIGIILAVEIFSVVTAGSLIRLRFVEGGTQESRQGQIRRHLTKTLSFAAGTSALILAVIRRDILRNLTIPVVFLSCNIGLIILSLLFQMYPHFRAITSFTYVFVGAIFALIARFGRWFSEAGIDNGFQFELEITVAIFCTAFSNALTCLAAWGLPHIGRQSTIGPARLKMLETAALGVTGPVVIIGIAPLSLNSATIVLFTVLPQIGSIIIPILVSHVFSLVK